MGQPGARGVRFIPKADSAKQMSALGQKRTYAVQNGMSALPPIATAKADSRKR
jgi:hypothetical protein